MTDERWEDTPQSAAADSNWIFVFASFLLMVIHYAAVIIGYHSDELD